MSSRRLKRWICYSVTWLLLYVALYVYTTYYMPIAADILETLLPIAIAIPAAFLAAGLSRRNSYLQALRDIWLRLIPAVQGAIQYTYLTSPSQSDFAQTEMALSIAIDELRCVFKNVPRKGVKVGLYPHENLKDIRKAILWIGYGDSFWSAQAAKARIRINRAWQNMHHTMLLEFDRDIPIRPVSKYLRGEYSEIDKLIYSHSNNDTSQSTRDS